MKLYLAHPLEKRKEIREYELDIEAETGVELINPFYDSDRDDIVSIDDNRTTRSDPKLDFRGIVSTDLALIRDSDGIVSYVENGVFSIGTFFELWDTMVKYDDKDVYIISPNCLTHPWIRWVLDETGGYGFKDFGGLKAHLKELVEFEACMKAIRGGI